MVMNGMMRNESWVDCDDMLRYDDDDISYVYEDGRYEQMRTN